jgi:hypothetical protein
MVLFNTLPARKTSSPNVSLGWGCSLRKKSFGKTATTILQTIITLWCLKYNYFNLAYAKLSKKKLFEK